MIRYSNRVLVFWGAAAIGSVAFLLLGSAAYGAGAAPDANDACALLTPADVAKATGIKVGAE